MGEGRRNFRDQLEEWELPPAPQLPLRGEREGGPLWRVAASPLATEGLSGCLRLPGPTELGTRGGGAPHLASALPFKWGWLGASPGSPSSSPGPWGLRGDGAGPLSGLGGSEEGWSCAGVGGRRGGPGPAEALTR